MESLRRGYQFLLQSWQMAFADRDLIKPTLMALVVGIFVTVIGGVPVIMTFLAFGDSNVGRILGYVLGAVLVFVVPQSATGVSCEMPGAFGPRSYQSPRP